MNILGENIVKLIGKITYKSTNVYGDSYNFRCKLAVPINDSFQYIKVEAWGTQAKLLEELPNGSYIKIYGHIEESSFEGNCSYCKGPSKIYWTVVVIDNFIKI